MGPKTLGAWLLGLCLLLAACVPSLDEKLTREGIGSDLHTADLGKQTDLQDQYLGFICHQAGAATTDGGDGFPRCDDENIDREGWRAVITAGMNDIDRRCDSYLAWLDNKKRSKDALIQQVTDIGDSTGAIMNISGADTQALGIVGIAFGLLRKSIENYHSRLLLEVESSTINTIVLERRNKYREQDVNNGFLIRYKPDVVHHIRSYLRLCLPFTIEMDINDLSTLRARGIDTRDTGSVVEPRDALGDPDAEARARVRAGRRPAPEEFVVEDSSGKVRRTDPTPPLVAAGAGTVHERSITPRRLRELQAALCVGEQTGAFDPDTRAAIKAYEEGYFFTRIGNPNTEKFNNGVIDSRPERSALLDGHPDVPNCTASQYKTPFEVGYGSKGNGDQLRGFFDLFKLLKEGNDLKPADAALPSFEAEISPDVRAFFEKVRKETCGLEGDVIDKEFVQCLKKEVAKAALEPS